jgi:hypothetical protein
MRQPDCYLKEYLDEIHKRYGVLVSVGRFSDILKDLGITHKKVRLGRLLANNSYKRKRHNEIKSSVMPGFERLPGGGPNKSFFLMNLVSIRAPEQGRTDGAPKGALFRTLSSFRSMTTSPSFLQ